MFDQIMKLQQMAHDWRESTSVMQLVKMILTLQEKSFNDCIKTYSGRIT